MKPSSHINMILMVLLVSFQNNMSQLHGADDPTKGFTNIPLTHANFEFQKPYNVPLDQRYSFENGVHRMWVYADDKSHSPDSETQPRTEIRIKVFTSYHHHFYIYFLTTDPYFRPFKMNYFCDLASVYI